MSAATSTALWVVPVPNFGGVARHTLDMARAGIPGYELVVLAPAGVLTERLKELGVRVIEAEFGPHAGLNAHSPRYYARLRTKPPQSCTVTLPTRMFLPQQW